MDILPMNVLDIGAIVFLLLSAIIGLILGFIRGGLFVISWLGSLMSLILLFPHVKPYSHRYIENDFFADVAGGATIFILTLIIFFLISSIIGGWVRNSRLNSLDRSLGMLAGLFTATVILATSYLISQHIWPEKNQPAWMVNSKSIVLIRKVAEELDELLPHHIETKARNILKNKKTETHRMIEKRAIERLVNPLNKNSITKDRKGYDKKERRGFENLLDRTE